MAMGLVLWQRVTPRRWRRLPKQSANASSGQAANNQIVYEGTAKAPVAVVAVCRVDVSSCCRRVDAVHMQVQDRLLAPMCAWWHAGGRSIEFMRGERSSCSRLNPRFLHKLGGNADQLWVSIWVAMPTAWCITDA